MGVASARRERPRGSPTRSWPARGGTGLHLFPLVTSCAQFSISEMRFIFQRTPGSSISNSPHLVLEMGVFFFKFVYKKTNLQTLGCFPGCYCKLEWERGYL